MGAAPEEPAREPAATTNSPEATGAPPPDEPVNIGRAQQRVRLLIGVVTLLATVLVAVWLIGFSGLAPLWRLALFVPFYAGAHSIIEARTGVCSYMAQRGQRNLEAVFARSGERIEDEALRDALIERSAQATLGAALAAGLATSVCVLVPAP